MYRIRNLINRRNISNNPSKNVDPSEDFIQTVLEAHILTAAMEIFEMDSLNDEPHNASLFSTADMTTAQKCDEFLKAVMIIVNSVVDISFDRRNITNTDGVFSYACDIASLGLLLEEFNDSIREGDGDRIIRCWKYFLLIFRITGRTNYAIEAFILLCQYYFLFSPRMAAQLKWSRTINTCGKPGRNISCDLYMEHLNRNVKCGMAILGSNVTPQPINRIGTSINNVSNILGHFDKVNGVPTQSYSHTRKSRITDINKIIEQLRSSQIFRVIPGRDHKTFPNYKSNMLLSIDKAELIEWMDEKLDRLLL